jgi:T5orf172 domain
VKPPVLLTKGYLYILSNPSMPGLLKIGLTTRTVPDRIAELSAATGVPSAFTVEAYFESSAPQQHEKTVHQKLGNLRVVGKEFFRVRLDEAVECIRGVTGNLPLGNPRQLSADERALMDLRDHIIASGRSAPEIRRCGVCHYAFFVAEDTLSCPRCRQVF